MKKLGERLRRREIPIALTLLLLGALLRFLWIGSFPPGLNQDEVSIGYDAWSLLHYGVDRNGDAWPVLFQSWGSGQNALYAWLSLPFLRLFGLKTASLRLCAALWGSGSLAFFWLLGRRSLGKDFGLLALAILCLNPWHLLLSRWALESNLLPAFLLLGVLFLCGAREKPWLLCAAAAAFALSLYAYGTAFLFLPLFLLGASLRILRRKTVGPRHYLASLALFLLLALPLILCHARNVLGLPAGRFLWMSLPALTETRQAATVSLSLSHLADLGKLLWKQSDGLPWNSAGPFGLLWGLPGLALTLLGLGRLLLLLARGGIEDARFYVLLSLLSALAAALFIDVNVNRVNFLFLPLVWCQAEGVYLLGKKLPALLPVLLLALLLAAGGLGRWYVTEGAAALAPAFHAGLTDAIRYADGLGTDSLWITGQVNAPYIYVLFALEIPPEEFISTVRYRDPDWPFRQVLSFGKYSFYGEAPAGLCILPRWEAAEEETLAVFGGYAVVKHGD